MKYFSPGLTLPFGYSSTALPARWATGSDKDPFYNRAKLIPCAKSFVLMLTDGVPTSDQNIPDHVLRIMTAIPMQRPARYAGDGTDYLDDVALYAHVNDLRTQTWTGMQTMDTYVIYAFGKDPDGPECCSRKRP